MSHSRQKREGDSATPMKYFNSRVSSNCDRFCLLVKVQLVLSSSLTGQETDNRTREQSHAGRRLGDSYYTMKCFNSN